MWVTTQRKDKTSGSRNGEKFWEEEKHSFGARMMNKMGWEQGKGLGKEGTGMNSYIQARKKNDSLGIGATVTQADEQFKASQSIYNDLLSRLTVASDGDGGIQPEDKTVVNTGVLMKQKMESRRLYSRFARARDVSNYSAEAMREILGKTKEPETPLLPTPIEKEEDDQDGLITTSSISMNDYFSQKLGKITQNMESRKSFSEHDQENYYNMMMGMSQTGRGGLGFSSADPSEHTQNILRKINPSKKPDPKKWGQGKDLPPPSAVDEKAPERQTMSLWVQEPKAKTKSEPEAKKAKKDKKDKKDKSEKKVQLSCVDIQDVAKVAGKVLAKSDGMSIDDLITKIAKKVSGAEQTHLLDAILGDKFAYGLMLKSKGTINGEVGKIVSSILKKADDWMDLNKTAKKAGKKLSRELNAREILTSLIGGDGVIVHIYNK